MDKVLFVCTANVCRSPMAQAIFNVLAEERGLLVQAESAGTAALEGATMAPNAVAALEEVGIYPEAHRTRQVSPQLIDEVRLVLAMSPQHTETLCHLRRIPPLGIHHLPEYATGALGEAVSDPYGLSMLAYRSVLRQLHEYVERVVDRLVR